MTTDSTGPTIDALGWERFLRQWSDEMLVLLQSAEENYDAGKLWVEARQAGYLGFPGATDAEIQTAESRLNVALPPSYRTFLKTSNGWRQLFMDAEDGLIFPANQIDWYRNKYPQSVETWLASQPAQDVYLKSALAISPEIDACIYLLIPEGIDADGEWEAWRLGWEVSGAERYRSFATLMEAEYARIIGDLKATFAYEETLNATAWGHAYQEALRKQGEGDIEGAIAAFTEALQNDPPPEWQRGALNWRSDLYRRTGHLEKALADMDALIALAPDTGTAMRLELRKRQLKSKR